MGTRIAQEIEKEIEKEIGTEMFMGGLGFPYLFPFEFSGD